jgi:hypothetical protein
MIMLDTRCQHAILPSQGHGIDHMRANPMQAVFPTLPDVL